MRGKKTSMITKLVVVGFAVYLSITLIGLQSQIESIETRRGALEAQVTQLEGENEIFYREIQDSQNPVVMERIARNRYNLVMPGERVFHGLAE